MKKKNKLIGYLNKVLSNFFIGTSSTKLIVILFLIFTFLIVACLFDLDNDFWFLINTGKHILNNGFPRIEPFTIHSNLDFIVQQWLSCTLFYLIYNNFGTIGMLFF